MAEETEDPALEESDLSEAQRKAIEAIGDEAEETDPPAAPPATPADETPPPEEKPAESPAAPAPETPATDPDPKVEGMAKALQKVQQDVQTLLRKQEEQGALNPKQKQLLQQSQDQAAALETDLAELKAIAERKPEDGDVYAESPKLAKHLLKQQEEIAALKKQLAERPAQPTQDDSNFWEVEAKAHPGVKVQEAWTSSITDAESRPAIKRAAALVKAGSLDQAEYDQMLREEASDLYRGRLKAAKADPPPKPKDDPPPPKPKTARQAPPTTPNGATVTVGKGAPTPGTPQSAEERQLAMIEKHLAY